jgi:hypothetical protein
MDGLLRKPSLNVVQMCMEIKSMSGNNTQEHNTESTITAVDTIKRKRLRGHNHRTSKYHRRIQISDSEQICEDHCKLARCCQYVGAGYSLSSNGVSTDIKGHHVVTNCFDTNLDSCQAYSNFCDHSSDNNGQDTSDVSTPSTAAKETVSPDSAKPELVISQTLPMNDSSENQMDDSLENQISTQQISSPSDIDDEVDGTKESEPEPEPVSLVWVQEELTPTPSSSSFPTDSSSPTPAPSPTPILQAAQSLEIAEACSGADNEKMILAGVLTARTRCIVACQNGLCCYPQKFGYSSWMSSCYDTNEEICLEYSPCLVLAGEVLDNDGSTDSTLSDNITAQEADDSNNNTSIESSSNTTVNNNTVATEGEIDIQNNNTTSDNSTVIEDIGNSTTDTVEAPPLPSEPPTIPTEDLDTLCSTDVVSTLLGLTDCERACEPGSCCILQNEESCYDTNEEICDLYQPCIRTEIVDEVVVQGNSTELGVEDEELQPESADIDTTSLNSTDTVESNVTTTTEQETFDGPVRVLPPEPPMNLPNLCSYESLKVSTISRQECYQLCRARAPCFDDVMYASQATMDMYNDICEMYEPCECQC